MAQHKDMLLYGNSTIHPAVVLFMCYTVCLFSRSSDSAIENRFLSVTACNFAQLLFKLAHDSLEYSPFARRARTRGKDKNYNNLKCKLISINRPTNQPADPFKLQYKTVA